MVLDREDGRLRSRIDDHRPAVEIVRTDIVRAFVTEVNDARAVLKFTYDAAEAATRSLPWRTGDM